MYMCAHMSRVFRCLIVRTEPYNKDAISKVLQLRANVEGLKLGDGVLDRLASRGADSSLRLVAHDHFTRSCFR